MKIAITTECLCDLPKSILEQDNIDTIAYEVYTEEGVFLDGEEIDANNVIEYIATGKMIKSHCPSAISYKRFFDKKLKDYDEVIHLCASKGIGEAYERASLALAKMGMTASRVHLVETKQIAGGMGILLQVAVEARKAGKSVPEILRAIEKMQGKIYTSFIVKNCDYLYYCGKVGETLAKLCHRTTAHPVLGFKNGELILRYVLFGNYRNACKRYLKRELNSGKPDSKTVFLEMSGCLKETRDRVCDYIADFGVFEEIIPQIAGATVSCNVGPNAFGIHYVSKKGER